MWKKNNILQLHWQKLKRFVCEAGKTTKPSVFRQNETWGEKNLCILKARKRLLNLICFSVVSVKKSKRKNMKKKWNQTFKFSPKLQCVAMMSIKCGTSFQNLMFHLNLFICFWKCENSFENYVISWRLTKTNLMEFSRNYKTFVDQIIKSYTFLETSQLFR